MRWKRGCPCQVLPPSGQGSPEPCQLPALPVCTGVRVVSWLLRVPHRGGRKSPKQTGKPVHRVLGVCCHVTALCSEQWGERQHRGV